MSEAGRAGGAVVDAGRPDSTELTRTPRAHPARGVRAARPPLYPLRFDPVFTANPWGGRRLPALLNRPAPHPGPVGEAWVLSDVDGSPTRVADGPLAGLTLRDLLAPAPERVVGPAAAPQGRFPLLLKFLDARQELSVQVHPDDARAALLGPGKFGKTEAWVVLDRDPASSRLYAGFADGVCAADFRAALAAGTAPGTLHCFAPEPGDCVFLEAGTVHAIGADLLLFEVQQTSDITYRLYDWGRVDAATGRPRQLHVEEGLACADFGRGPCRPVRPAVSACDGARREGLVSCAHFTLERLSGAAPFRVGAAGRCRAVVCAAGSGALAWSGAEYPLRPGDVYLLPAEVGAATAVPTTELTLLECGLAE